ncbi:very-short-patch-repair endonuclease [Natronospira proteinivora]|uniref:Very-short-patch-repair endonuclease n=1 Tax=Natronospira proteinivora TaxID=1807133 RepID=A0ABT1G703_9GAMM|nr:DUF559 domain-containing protein [Natronospira proteinivora]MCP1727086.1 very-short-patch-repair endonuclease [Natronospira proteinivora]
MMSMPQNQDEQPTLMGSLLPQDSAEKTLWKRLRHHQLGVLFRRRHPLGSQRVDFYCPDAAVVVVVEQETIDCEEQAARIREEDDRFRRFGLETLRFSDEEVLENTDRVVVDIFRAVQKRLMPSARLG